MLAFLSLLASVASSVGRALLWEIVMYLCLAMYLAPDASVTVRRRRDAGILKAMKANR